MIELGLSFKLDSHLLILTFIAAGCEFFSLVVSVLDLTHSIAQVTDAPSDQEMKISHLLCIILGLVLSEEIGLLLLSYLFNLSLWECLDGIFVLLDFERFLLEFSLVHEFLLDNSFVELFSGCSGVKRFQLGLNLFYFSHSFLNLLSGIVKDLVDVFFLRLDLS